MDRRVFAFHGLPRAGNVGCAVRTLRTKAPSRNKLVNFAGRSGRVAALLVVAIARYGSASRLAPHPATAAKLPKLSLRDA
ncbi:MAG: hypothetical protein V7606_3792 [Burkholderiales bacterium]